MRWLLDPIPPPHYRNLRDRELKPSQPDAVTDSMNKATCDDSQAAFHRGGGNCTHAPDSASRYSARHLRRRDFPLPECCPHGFGTTGVGRLVASAVAGYL